MGRDNDAVENMAYQHLIRVANGRQVISFVPLIQHADVCHELLLLVIGQRDGSGIEQTREFIQHNDIHEKGQRDAGPNLTLGYALRRSKPCFLSHTSKMEMAAGVMPEIRDAWPIDDGL